MARQPRKADENDGTKSYPVAQCLISTRPRYSQCRRCGVPVLSCYVVGTRRYLAPYALDQRGEALALLAGAHTFALPILGRRGPAIRSAAMIRRGLPDYGRVLHEHRCGLDLSAYPDHREWFAGPIPSGAPCPF